MHQINNPPTLHHNPGSIPIAHLFSQQATEKMSASLYIGGRLPPVPAKLANRIQDGQFVEMAELLLEWLRGTNPHNEDQLKSSKSKYKEISSIVDWIQCFSLYIAIISRS